MEKARVSREKGAWCTSRLVRQGILTSPHNIVTLSWWLTGRVFEWSLARRRGRRRSGRRPIRVVAQLRENEPASSPNMQTSSIGGTETGGQILLACGD